MRILLLSQWFDPEPTSKGITFARELTRIGHEVQVLTGYPNYPGGKVYPGYEVRGVQREVMDGIEVVRVPLYPSHDPSSLNRIANYGSFALSSTVLGPLCIRRADVAYVHHPPATIGLPAMAFQLLKGIPAVYDIQDLWPDTLKATGMLRDERLIGWIDRWCNLLYRRMDQIVALSPGFRRKLIERGVPPEKVGVIYNWCEEDQLKPGERDEALAGELGFTGRFNFVFAGTMGQVQALDSVIEAAAMLERDTPRAQFVFVGGGIKVDDLKAKFRAMGLRNVRFIPRMSRTEVNKVLNLADVLLVHLKDDPLFEITIPSKTQAYFSVGRPVLMGVRGDAADLVRRANAGLTCEPEDPRSLADAARRFCALDPAELQRMGENGRRFYLEEMSLRTGVLKFEEVFKRAVEGRRHPSFPSRQPA